MANNLERRPQRASWATPVVLLPLLACAHGARSRHGDVASYTEHQVVTFKAPNRATRRTRIRAHGGVVAFLRSPGAEGPIDAREASEIAARVGGSGAHLVTFAGPDAVGDISLELEERDVSPGESHGEHGEITVLKSGVGGLPRWVVAFARSLDPPGHKPKLPPAGPWPLPAPLSLALDVRYELVDRSWAPQRAEDLDLRQGTVHVMRRSESGPGTLHEEVRLETASATIDETGVALLEAQRRKSHTAENVYAITSPLGRAGRLVEHGHFGRAALVLLVGVDREPERPRPLRERVLLVHALARAGFREAALREAEATSRAFPREVEAILTRVLALRHDMLGLSGYTPAEHTEMRAAFDRASAVAPDDLGLKGALTIFLGNDERGRPLYHPDQLAPALAIARQARRAGLSNDPGYFTLLARSGDVIADMEELASAALRGDDDVHAAFRVLALARLRSLEAAVDELAKRFPSSERRARILARAGRFAGLLWRDYPLARKVLAQAKTAGGAVDDELELAGHTVRHERLTLGASPAFLWDRIVLASAETRIAPDSRWFHPCATEARPRTTRVRALPASPAAHISLFEDDEAAPGANRDRALARLARAQRSVEGDDRSGYRVSYRVFDGDESDRILTIWAAPADGTLKVVAHGFDRPAIGCRVHALLEAGQLEAARRWLDWAHDELTEGDQASKQGGPAFERFWRRARAGEAPLGGIAGRAVVKAGLALLLADFETPLQKKLAGSDPFAPLRGRAAESASDQAALTVAEAQLALHVGQLERGLALARRAHAEDPGAADPVLVEAFILDRLHRPAEAARLLAASRASASLAYDRGVLRRIATRGLGPDGDLAAARAAASDALDLKGARAVDYNRAAWLAVVADDIDARAHRWADQAVDRSGRGVRTHLHTLAMIVASRGGIDGGRRILVEANGFPDARLPSDDYLVLGRLAEAMGFWNDALARYRRIKSDDGGAPPSDDIVAIVRRRVAAIATKRADDPSGARARASLLDGPGVQAGGASAERQTIYAGR